MMDENPYEAPQAEAAAVVPSRNYSIPRSRVGSWVFMGLGVMGAVFVILVVIRVITGDPVDRFAVLVVMAVGVLWSASSFYISGQMRREAQLEDRGE